MKYSVLFFVHRTFPAHFMAQTSFLSQCLEGAVTFGSVGLAVSTAGVLRRMQRDDCVGETLSR